MGRKVYISFKTEDIDYKTSIQDMAHFDFVDKSLNEPINSTDEDYIMRRIREDYLHDSTVTIFLIGAYSSENRGYQEQRFIKRELQASLYSSASHLKSGILGVVLPHMMEAVYKGQSGCQACGQSHNIVKINDDTVISEFSYNYYIPNDKCAHGEDDRYCVLVPWTDFEQDPEIYVERAFQKRTAPIADETRVRP